MSEAETCAERIDPAFRGLAMSRPGPEVLDRVLIPGLGFGSRYGLCVMKSIICVNRKCVELLIGF